MREIIFFVSATLPTHSHQSLCSVAMPSLMINGGFELSFGLHSVVAGWSRGASPEIMALLLFIK